MALTLFRSANTENMLDLLRCEQIGIMLRGLAESPKEVVKTRLTVIIQWRSRDFHLEARRDISKNKNFRLPRGQSVSRTSCYFTVLILYLFITLVISSHIHYRNHSPSHHSPLLFLTWYSVWEYSLICSTSTGHLHVNKTGWNEYSDEWNIIKIRNECNDNAIIKPN